MKLAAAAVAVKHRRGDVQGGRHGDPDLPVREDARDGKFAGDANIRGETPESQHVSHQRGGNQQGPAGQRHMPVLAMCIARGVTLAQFNANDHEMNRPR
jgi:hypothetical protein